MIHFKTGSIMHPLQFHLVLHVGRVDYRMIIMKDKQDNALLFSCSSPKESKRGRKDEGSGGQSSTSREINYQTILSSADLGKI